MRWDNLQDSLEDRMLEEAIRDTEVEIFNDALGVDDDRGDRVIDEASKVEGWDGPIDDGELLREMTGEIPPGMAGVYPTAGEEELAAENRQLRGQLAAIYEQLPEPEPADLFSDPERFTQETIERAAGRMPLDRGQPLPVPSPFDDPTGYANAVAMEARRLSGRAEHESDRVNASLHHAVQEHGQEALDAYNDILALARSGAPEGRRAIQQIWAAPDSGSALMQVHGALVGANQAARKYGGPAFAPMLRSGRARPSATMESRGYGRQVNPQFDTYEEAEEAHVFDSIWD